MGDAVVFGASGLGEETQPLYARCSARRASGKHRRPADHAGVETIAEATRADYVPGE